MALTVATNTGALMAQAAASSVNKEMEMSMERLATGKRINGASDDAAGVAIASRLTSEIRGTNQAIRNAMDGQALIDTAEGAHQEIESILQRMRELSVQASNDTNDANDRANLQLEMDQLSTEIDRISSTTSWAGQALMDGTGSFSFQVGSQTTSADSISASLASMSAAGLGIGAGGTTTAANSASIAEVGDNALQVSGAPAAGDVFNFTVGGTDMAVKVTQVGATPAVTTTSANTVMTVSGNDLTVDSFSAGSFNVNVNGTDVQVTGSTDTATTAAAIKTAVDAHTDFASMGVSLAVVGSTVTFSPTTTYDYSIDGGTTYSVTDQTVASNGAEGAASAITAAINARTSSDFLGLTATAGSDGSISLDQAVNFSAASVASGATVSLDMTGVTVDGSVAVSVTNLTGFSHTTSSASITTLASDLQGTDEIKTATVNGSSIDIVFEGNSATTAGYNLTIADAESSPNNGTLGTVTVGDDDASLASTSADGTVLTLAPFNYEPGNDMTFTINGEAFTVAISSSDKYEANQLGLIAKIQDTLDASVNHGGMTFTVAANSGVATSIDITATAATTDLSKDVSAVAASTTTATSGLSVTTTASAQTSINAIDTRDPNS
jgi:flagellin